MQYRNLFRRSRYKLVILAAVAILICVSALLATPSFGFVVNQILASGTTSGNMNQQIQIAGNPDGSTGNWQLQLQAQGQSDFYVQQLALMPGGYSGWHTHPGLLVGTVVSGSVDFYNANCEKQTIEKGQVYIENSDVHAIINNGSAVAELSIAYLVKHGAARRMEADAPSCAAGTGIP